MTYRHFAKQFSVEVFVDVYKYIIFIYTMCDWPAAF